MASLSLSILHVMVLVIILETFYIGGCLAVKIASLSSSLGNEHPYNPCKFNPTCLCSTGGMFIDPFIVRMYLAKRDYMYRNDRFYFLFKAAEYGSVVCDGVPMADIPTELQDSRVFKLHLRSNGLTRFPDSKLEGTGK